MCIFCKMRKATFVFLCIVYRKRKENEVVSIQQTICTCIDAERNMTRTKYVKALLIKSYKNEGSKLPLHVSAFEIRD